MTHSPPDPVTMLEVIQDDRDAAFALCGLKCEVMWAGDMIREGKVDHHEYVQAFVRHRLTHLSASPAGDGDITAVWRQAEDNHRRYSATGSREDDLRFLTLGLAGEAGEAANFVKKRWRDGVGHDEEIRREIADVCAYAFMLASTLGMSPASLIAEIAEKQRVFVAKMQIAAAPPAKQTGEGE